MSTDARARRRGATVAAHASAPWRVGGALGGALALALALAAAAAVRPASAQIHVDAATEVRAIRFSGVTSREERRLRNVIRTRDRGAAYGLRVALGRLPLVPAPEPHPFSPLELQRDVVRLRGNLRDAGYLDARVRYDVRRDPAKNLLDIAFVIAPGAPTLVDSVAITGSDSVTALAVPDSLAQGWGRVQAAARTLRGRRLDMETVRAQAVQLRAWWADRGHPSAAAGAALDADSVRHVARVRYVVDPGTLARFGPVTVAGNPSVSDGVVRRELPFRPGDTYSAGALTEGRTELQQLEIIRSVAFTVPPRPATPAAPDGYGPDVPVQVNLYEAKPRYVAGDFGYGSDEGVMTEARWVHRNFTGGARTLTVTGTAQTGWLAYNSNPEVLYRASASLLQPYLFHRKLSFALSPFVERRDDHTDRSLQYGSNATLIFRAATERTASLDYRIARQNVYQYRLEDVYSGDVSLFTLLHLASQGFLDSLGTSLLSSTVTLSARVGALDRPLDPRTGWLFRPTVRVTAPPALSSTEFWKLDGTLNAFARLFGGARFAGRLAAGRLLPFGKSIPHAGEDPRIKFLQLQDEVLTAGGSGNVRGWGYELLGPKAADVRFGQAGDSTTYHAVGFVPIGGLSRTAFSLELRLPMPGFGDQFESQVFLDGGRVWQSDSRFGTPPDSFEQQRWFYAAGAGIDLVTPIGPIRLSAGYKLNPSVIDLIDANEFLHARLSGAPVDLLQQKNGRRWAFHLEIGSGI